MEAYRIGAPPWHPACEAGAMATTQFEREIREQPEVIARLIEDARQTAEAIARRIREAAPAFVLLAARGSSDDAARYGKYVLGVRNRLACALAAPSLHTLYGTPPSLEKAVVIGISQSGRSPDVVAVLDDARAQGALTIAITNDASSPLARAATCVLALGAGDERAVAASKTYTAQLAALAMLSAGLGGDPAAWQQLDAVPDACRAALSTLDAARAGASALKKASRLVVLGRGLNLSTAFEAALKLEETCYLVAQPYSFADFLHGPIAMVDRGFPVVMIAPSGAALEGCDEVARQLRERRAQIVTISDDDDMLAMANVALRLPSGVPEWLSPLVAVVPAQLLALALAEVRGVDPDQPRGLSKVTETR